MLMNFTNQFELTLVERQSYVGNISSFAPVVGLSGNVYLRTLNEEQTAINGLQWGQAKSIVYDTSLDLRVGDRLTINNVVYIVKGVLTNDRGTICDFSKALITKPQV